MSIFWTFNIVAVLINNHSFYWNFSINHVDSGNHRNQQWLVILMIGIEIGIGLTGHKEAD